MRSPLPHISALQDPATIPIKDPEFREQARLVAALRRCWLSLSEDSRPIVFAVPNGGKRDAREGANLKAQGVLAGVPDLGILLPGARTVLLEMKADNGRLSNTQCELHRHIASLEHTVLVAWSAEEALQVLLGTGLFYVEF